MSNNTSTSDFCAWHEDCDGAWHTDCGESWEFVDGTPKENRVRFCHRCGKPMQQHEYQEEQGDE